MFVAVEPLIQERRADAEPWIGWLLCRRGIIMWRGDIFSSFANFFKCVAHYYTCSPTVGEISCECSSFVGLLQSRKTNDIFHSYVGWRLVLYTFFSHKHLSYEQIFGAKNAAAYL